MTAPISTISALEAMEVHEAIAYLWTTAIRANLPVACWQLPHQSEKHLIVDFTGGETIERPEVEVLPKGFLVGPFLNESCPNFFIQAGLHYKTSEGSFQENFDAERFGTKAYANAQRFYQLLEEHIQQNTSEEVPYFSTNKSCEGVDKECFESMVEEGVRQICEKHFHKVVLSRMKTVKLKPGFNLLQTYWQIAEAYPRAFVSAISVPEYGTWVGATPELLISVENEEIFRTVSLAGTQSRDLFPSLSDVSWKQKEIEEQALVCRYIISCFKKIRLREYDEVGPRTVEAGHLVHLKSDYTVNMKDVNFPQLGSVMLELLHPTSAVCGMPKPEALKFIVAHEKYERSLYSGFLGPVNIENNTRIFVNLRCMQLLEGEALLYAGAGITFDSDPAKEWKETELKMNIMGKFL
ncbi:chorismate-binding protein [Rapidithrix thailandica]|uniref:Chorismate-binding protein n=1 Tax=Rapidithrix thailandica TaxID=413964 RepID=A0AAW9S3J1_9BACT